MSTKTLLSLVLLCVAGCEANPLSPAGAFAPVSDVDDMVVQSSPVAVNWDERPGPDGLEMAIYFFRASQNQPVPVRGSVEFKLYEGKLAAEQLAKAPVFQEWRYSSAELRSALQRTSFGWGYAFRLAWLAHVPQSTAVTVTIRYTSPTGKSLLARPVTIPMSAE